MSVPASAWRRIAQDGSSSDALGRDRMLFALFLAAVVHAGLILGLPSPFPSPAERDIQSIAILLAPPPPETAPPSSSDDAAPRPRTPRPAAERPVEATPVAAPAPAPEVPANTPETLTGSRAPDAWRMRNYAQTVREIARAGDDAANDRSSRVRRLTGVTPATPELSYYFEAWRRKIERVGNLNYPDAARDRNLYGSLRLLVAIVPDGTLSDVRVLESSGHRILDDAALRIVRLAAPFAPFPPEMRRNTDVLEIVRTWQFRKSRGGFRTL